MGAAVLGRGSCRLQVHREEALLAPLGVDGNDLTAAPSHQQHTLQPLSQDLQELHVCRWRVSRSLHCKGRDTTPNLSCPSTAEKPSPEKDTVLVSFRVAWGAWHVEQHQLGLMGLVDDDLIELDGCVHASYVGLVSAWRVRRDRASVSPPSTF